MSNVPPPIIDSAKLLAFAFNDQDVEFTDRIELLVGDEQNGVKRLGEVPNLAICANYCVPGDVLLLFCNAQWEAQGVISFSTIDGAKIKAERGYKGISKKWVDSPYSSQDVEEYLRQVYEVDPKSDWWKMVCSFCGKDQTETDSIIAGLRANICRECAVAVYDAFQETGASSS